LKIAGNAHRALGGPDNVRVRRQADQRSRGESHRVADEPSGGDRRCARPPVPSELRQQVVEATRLGISCFLWVAPATRCRGGRRPQEVYHPNGYYTPHPMGGPDVVQATQPKGKMVMPEASSCSPSCWRLP